LRIRDNKIKALTDLNFWYFDQRSRSCPFFTDITIPHVERQLKFICNALYLYIIEGAMYFIIYSFSPIFNQSRRNKKSRNGAFDCAQIVPVKVKF
jgi:hypothetical protein